LKVAIVKGKELKKYDFGPGHPFRGDRFEDFFSFFEKKIALDGRFEIVANNNLASDSDLRLWHTTQYIDAMGKASCGIEVSDLFRFLSGDNLNPQTRRFPLGIESAARVIVASSILACDLVLEGSFEKAISIGGGLHHATSDSAAGFCVFNDIAVATRHLQKEYDLEKIAIIDVDGHHGDGTQRILYEEPLLKISFHRYGQRFYPGSGKVDEIGEGSGKGYSVNVPLPIGTSHQAFLYAFDEIVPPLIRKYEPEILLNQFGVDGHYEDPLVGLGLTTETFREISFKMHELAHENSEGRYLIFGGGGYEPLNVARCWAIMFTTVSGIQPMNKKEYENLFDAELRIEDYTFDIVKETVEEVKELIFPFHKL